MLGVTIVLLQLCRHDFDTFMTGFKGEFKPHSHFSPNFVTSLDLW